MRFNTYIFVFFIIAYVLLYIFDFINKTVFLTVTMIGIATFILNYIVHKKKNTS